MSNLVQWLINDAISTANNAVNNFKIKVDEDKISSVSNKLGTIASEIEMAATELEGPISETQPVWTGQAAEEFFAELSKLLTETKEIGSKISENRTQIDTAVSIIMAAENNVKTDVSNLSDGTIFKNI